RRRGEVVHWPRHQVGDAGGDRVGLDLEPAQAVVPVGGGERRVVVGDEGAGLGGGYEPGRLGEQELQVGPVLGVVAEKVDLEIEVDSVDVHLVGGARGFEEEVDDGLRVGGDLRVAGGGQPVAEVGSRRRDVRLGP